jgi:hypothetical protein
VIDPSAILAEKVGIFRLRLGVTFAGRTINMPIFSEGRVVLGSLAALTFWLFIGLPLLKARDQMDLGTVPQWLTFISQLLTFVGVVVGFYITARQLQHNRHVREMENLISVSDSTIAHDARFLERPLSLKAVELLEGLNMPDSESDAKTYWAFRGVHLSHLELICRVWQLDGAPECGKAMSAKLDGWERFAREIVTKKLRASAREVKNGGTAPADLAASDLWFGLHTYECFPTKFVQWLDGLDQ